MAEETVRQACQGNPDRAAERPVRAPYRKPSLNHLGTVRQATFGSPGPAGESGSPFPGNFRN